MHPARAQVQRHGRRADLAEDVQLVRVLPRVRQPTDALGGHVRHGADVRPLLICCVGQLSAQSVFALVLGYPVSRSAKVGANPGLASWPLNYVKLVLILGWPAGRSAKVGADSGLASWPLA